MRRLIALSILGVVAAGCAETPTTAAPEPEGEFTLLGYRGVLEQGGGVRYVFDPAHPPRVKSTSRVTAAAVKAEFHPHLIGTRIEHHGGYHFQKWPKWARELRGEGTVTLLVEEYRLGDWPARLTDDPAAELQARLRDSVASAEAGRAAAEPLLDGAGDAWARGWIAYHAAQAMLRAGTATAAAALLTAELPRAEAGAPGTLPAALHRLGARAAADPAARAAHLDAAAAALPAEDAQESLRLEAERADGDLAALREIAKQMQRIGVYGDAARLAMRIARAAAAAGDVESARAALAAAPIGYVSKALGARVDALAATIEAGDLEVRR